ncbi:MAG: hypothetical protein HONBIEJF_00345 [Fimbriimonadaceae bacterium]|nr:hypothetical protein [Fimbriimonadaceae bacterium]
MNRRSIIRSFALGMWIAIVAIASAQINVPSNGSSGQLNVTADTELDLSQCPTGTWNQLCATGNGVYDPVKWAVVYHWSAINISPGAKLTFKNHPKNPPVVFLVQGNVVIDGTIDASAKAVVPNDVGIPGPGGFRGGYGKSGLGTETGGFGPGAAYGGGSGSYNSGSYGTQGQNNGYQFRTTYGNSQVVPLIGGSGGAGDPSLTLGLAGGGGGGALLIASRLTVQLNGTVQANGAHGGVNQNNVYGGDGSGGGIRLICQSLQGPVSAMVEARSKPPGGGINGGGRGGDGRIRLEFLTASFNGTTYPIPSSAVLESDPVIWPASDAPTCRILSIDGQNVATDPKGALNDVDVTLTKGYVTTIIECRNVPVDGSWRVGVRQMSKTQTYNSPLQATLVGGNQILSTWKLDFWYLDRGVVQPIAQKL